MILADIYQEVYEVLYNMDKLTVMRIPVEVLKKIVSNRNPNYRTQIDEDDLFNEDNMSKEAVDLLCWLNYEFLIDRERKRIIDTKVESLKREKYNPDKLFANNNPISSPNN